MAEVQTSNGPAAAVAISAENLSETEKAALLAVDNHNTPQETPLEPVAEPTTPELIGGKFKTQEDLLSAYQALESKSTKDNQTPPAEPAEGELTIQAAAEATTGDANAFDKYTEEFAQAGVLAETSYAELQSKGINRAMIDTYIRGQQAVADEFTSAVYEIAGDQEKYTQVTTWAAQNLTPGEQLAFNTAVESGNKEQAKLATSGLMARYNAANGSAPRLLTGDAAGAAASDVFDNYSQVTKVMTSTEYRTDPAYRAKVDAKIARSPNL